MTSLTDTKTTRAEQQQHEWTSLADTKTTIAAQQQHKWTSLTDTNTTREEQQQHDGHHWLTQIQLEQNNNNVN